MVVMVQVMLPLLVVVMGNKHGRRGVSDGRRDDGGSCSGDVSGNRRGYDLTVSVIMMVKAVVEVLEAVVVVIM